MIGIAVLAVLVPAAAFVLWPLLRPDGDRDGPSSEVDPVEAATAEEEEVELDLASGRLSAADAGRRLAELRRR